MFDKFGEFDSVEELNRSAAAQREEGDEEALVLLSKENGIDKEDAEDYMDGCLELASVLMAAVGKLNVEKEELKIKGILSDWVDELVTMCTENESFARAVRKKGKDLAGYIAMTAESGYKHRAVVDKRIVDKAPKIKGIVGSHEFSIGVPDKKTRRELATKYYLD